MAMEVILTTDDFVLAQAEAYNYQAVLINNHTGKVITDFSNW
ncbi:hypothetical protein ACFSQ3_09635 [Sphingobacterium corticis]|uniref:Uncharacterized protein n=1 Tax=Sphingobacterium corticis TaxID=1812823 RepID=A0ABW5NMM3_9SPHI